MGMQPSQEARAAGESACPSALKLPWPSQTNCSRSAHVESSVALAMESSELRLLGLGAAFGCSEAARGSLEIHVPQSHTREPKG